MRVAMAFHSNPLFGGIYMHITIDKKEQCCGCGACINACSKECISMTVDEEGFCYPVLDEVLCIECGKCISVCPMLNKPNKDKYNGLYYAAYSIDNEDLLSSSSGGVFGVLAKKIIHEGGIVYGAYLDEGFIVRHGRADNIEGINRFKKSKYLQSDVGKIYCEVKNDLREGRLVLFSGTPCQIAALYLFLGDDPDNLLTIDIVCHGVPSKKVFETYIKQIEQRNGKVIANVCWRDKRKGWGPNRIAMTFKDGTEIVTTSSENIMQQAFLNNYDLRKSCYVCEYAALPRIGDITLGDFWGYEGKLLKENNNRGISMVVISSKKGENLFDTVVNNLILEKVDEELCKIKSYHLHSTPKTNLSRDDFMNCILKGNSVEMSFGRCSTGCIAESDNTRLDEYIRLVNM